MKELAKKIHSNAKQKGFYDSPFNFAEKVMLIVSELSESLEADRKCHDADLEAFYKRLGELENSINTDVVKPENIEGLKQEYFIACFTKYIKNSKADELADSIIRTLDLCEFLNIDIDKHIELKMKYNATRPFMHGKKY